MSRGPTELKAFVRRCLVRLGAARFLRRVLRGRRAAVLRYHAVVDPRTVDYAVPSICIAPEDFETQVRYIARHYTVTDLDTLHRCLVQGEPFPPDAVVLTFDDGYADNFEAFRILRSHGLTATFYVCTGPLDGTEPLWLPEAVYRFRKTAARRIRIRAGSADLDLPAGDPAETESSLRSFVRLVKTHPREVRDQAMESLRRATRDVEDCESRMRRIMLTWDQVREMAGAGMTIGGHTVTHLNLPHADPGDARQEIAGCKRAIEAALGREVRHFSYPNGGGYAYFNDQVVAMVRDAGYATATTSQNGVVRAGSDPFRMERVRITGSLTELVYAIDCDPVVEAFR